MWFVHTEGEDSYSMVILYFKLVVVVEAAASCG